MSEQSRPRLCCTPLPRPSRTRRRRCTPTGAAARIGRRAQRRAYHRVVAQSKRARCASARACVRPRCARACEMRTRAYVRTSEMRACVRGARVRARCACACEMRARVRLHGMGVVDRNNHARPESLEQSRAHTRMHTHARAHHAHTRAPRAHARECGWREGAHRVKHVGADDDVNVVRVPQLGLLRAAGRGSVCEQPRTAVLAHAHRGTRWYSFPMAPNGADKRAHSPRQRGAAVQSSSRQLTV